MAGPVDPEDLAQDIGDLAEGRHPPQGLADRDEDVLGPPGRRRHIGQGAVDGGLVAPARTERVRSIWAFWSSGSMGKTSSASRASSVNLFTPMTIFSPSSMALA